MTLAVDSATCQNGFVNFDDSIYVTAISVTKFEITFAGIRDAPTALDANIGLG